MGFDTTTRQEPLATAGPVVPLRPSLGVLAVGALTVAICTQWSELPGIVAFLPVAACSVACLFALAACVLRPRDWLPPVWLGRAAVVGVCLFLTVQGAVRLFVQTNDAGAWVKVSVALVALAIAAVVFCDKRLTASPVGALLTSLALFLTGTAAFHTRLFPDHRRPVEELIRVAAITGFVLTASLLSHLGTPTVRWRRLLVVQVVLLFVTGAVLRLAAVAASPEPPIDVYYAQDGAAGYLLKGENPYAADYPDPLKPGTVMEGAPFYPPLPLLLGAAVRSVGCDVRLGNIGCDLIAALALLLAAWTRGDRLLGALLAACYLHFPRVPLLMENAWYEPMLAAALGTGLLLVSRGWRVGYFLLGLGFTGKQYMVVCLPPLLRALQGRRWAVLLGTALAGAVVLLFFLWDTHAFLERVVVYHLRLESRADGLTLQAAVIRATGYTVPKPLFQATALALMAWVTWRTPTKNVSPAPWMATTLLVFCLFHSQAFINYYYLVQYLFLLGMADWFVRDAAAAARPR